MCLVSRYNKTNGSFIPTFKSVDALGHKNSLFIEIKIFDVYKDSGHTLLN